MPFKRKQLNVWGQRQSAFQLSDALQSNRSEFLELCRRVTLDETSANKLVGLVEQILNSNEENQDLTPPNKQSLFEEIKLNARVQSAPRSILTDHQNTEALEDQTNLIQLLAEVHMMEITRKNRKISKSE